jgi:hypothetical protein
VPFWVIFPLKASKKVRFGYVRLSERGGALFWPKGYIYRGSFLNLDLARPMVMPKSGYCVFW